MIELLGTTVYEKDINANNQVEIQLPHNLVGVFYLKVEGAKGKVYTTKLILNE